ncbi:MAG: glycine--tRNA ligase subunit beta [Candidatus Caenarcaniphilales bacterium]|nr:glycine--tRNA ligase subunit beta [Candidatus Caenarcaniphilales bacterium]
MDYLLEIGTEELPVSAIQSIARNLEKQLLDSLGEKGLSRLNCRLYTTPRRIAVMLQDLPAESEAKTEIIKGPPVNAADQAIDGFARKNGLNRESLRVEDGRYCAQKEIPALKITDLLTDSLTGVLTSLKGERWMSWGEGIYQFMRPVRWVVSLADDQVFPLSIFGVSADRLSRPNRLIGSDENILIPDTKSYLDRLEKGLVIADREARRQSLKAQINQLEHKHNFKVDLIAELEEEVLDLLEYPLATSAQFEEEFLSLPEFLIREVLIKHQRYFPVYEGSKLSHRFVFIANCLQDALDTVIKGNQRVLRARLNDGQHFTQTDLKTPLIDLKPKLSGMTFQKELEKFGLDSSMLGKAERIMELADRLADLANLSQPDKEQIKHAAKLMKCDLVSNLVYEFPELQGKAGGFIALSQGEPEVISAAISEQYENLPSTPLGQIISLSDKFENLFSLFLIGKIPTGSADPFALRRQAFSVINILLKNQLGKMSISEKLLPALLASYAGNKHLNFDLTRLIDFMNERIIFTFKQNFDDIPEELIRSFISGNAHSPQAQEGLLGDLMTADKSSFANIRRVQRMLKSFAEPVDLSVNKLNLPEEKNLYQALESFRQSSENSWSKLTVLSQPIEIFFEKVLVDDKENPDASLNRQALLRAIMQEVDHTYGSLDWNQLVSFAES